MKIKGLTYIEQTIIRQAIRTMPADYHPHPEAKPVRDWAHAAGLLEIGRSQSVILWHPAELPELLITLGRLETPDMPVTLKPLRAFDAA